MLTAEQTQQYLAKIHFSGAARPDFATLCQLQRQHLFYIPYENLDILNGTPLSLEPEHLFEKIILHQRGGYCFELQGLYKELLESIGFSVCQYAGRFMNSPDIIQMRRHRILVVTLNGKRYLTDIGVRGESPRVPMELTEGLEQGDGISFYRFRRDAFFGWVLMQKEMGKPWQDMYGFTEESQLDIDYIMPSFFCEQHPDSTFNKFMKISIFTPDSNLTIVDGVFKVYRQAKVCQRLVLQDNQAVRQILEREFSILPPESYEKFLR